MSVNERSRSAAGRRGAGGRGPKTEGAWRERVRHVRSIFRKNVGDPNRKIAAMPKKQNDKVRQKQEDRMFKDLLKGSNKPSVRLALLSVITLFFLPTNDLLPMNLATLPRTFFLQSAHWRDTWSQFVDHMRALRLKIVDVAPDGNCLFRCSVALDCSLATAQFLTHHCLA